jgi:threonine/homoserine/homoserine lactone efflux protein
MISAISQGIVLGLILSVLVGVTFFTLIETSLRYGFRSAIFMSVGVISSDATILFIVWFSSKGSIESIMNSELFRILSCLLFMGFGIFYLFNSRNIKLDSRATDKRKFRLFLLGFTVNTFNPSVLIYWTGAIIVAISKQHFTGNLLFLYFGTALGVVLLVDITKIYFAGKIKPLLTVKTLKWIYISVGILFFLFGLRLLLVNH